MSLLSFEMRVAIGFAVHQIGIRFHVNVMIMTMNVMIMTHVSLVVEQTGSSCQSSPSVIPEGQIT